jgi:hypothetical protein
MALRGCFNIDPTRGVQLRLFKLSDRLMLIWLFNRGEQKAEGGRRKAESEKIIFVFN